MNRHAELDHTAAASRPEEAAPTPARPRKEEILDVATRLFAERGFEGTSINDVAALVGMRKASLFYHFATKEALYEAVLNRLIQKLAAPLAEAYRIEGSFVDRLDAATEALVSVLAQRPFAARLLLREAMELGPVARENLLTPMCAVLEAAASFIRAGQDAGAFAPGDAKQLVLTTVGCHVLPFAIAPVVERYVGTSPFEPGFVATRRAELRVQVRRLLLR